MHDLSHDNCIKLSFPVNAAYVSSARITASSIASRMTFDIDEIEDIKTAVSEACTYIIKALPANTHSNFEIIFYLHSDSIDINITAKGVFEPVQPDDMGLIMVKALVDGFEIESGGNGIIIKMVKNHKTSIFG